MNERDLILSLKKKEKSIAVIGLGYVGLPLALALAKKFRVVGFDINEERVRLMKNQKDPSNEIEAEQFDNSDIDFCSDPEVFKGC